MSKQTSRQALAPLNVIELTGSPCAGKSYLADQLQVCKGLITCDKSWLNKAMGIDRLPTILRAPYREVHLFFWGTICLGISRDLKLLSTILRTPWSLRRRLNVWRNTLHKYAVHRLVSRQDVTGMVLYDEGISHLPFLFATSRNPCPEEIRQYYPFGRPKIIRVTAKREDIIQRLKTRGHKMIAQDNEIDDFVAANEQAYILQTQDLAAFPQNSVIQDRQGVEEIMVDLQKWIAT